MIDPRVDTETHMNRAEVDRFHIKGYDVKAKSCRTVASIGGVLILVSTEIGAGKITKLPTYPALLNACSLITYPRELEAGGIRLTGVSFSPSARGSGEDIASLTPKQNQTKNRNGD